ncbi:MAG: chemotaxis protein CheW [Deltaproteobacteria bacterium]|nr:chemotaxis protein CheW [Deltaproteobacteria bacterium]
MATELHVTFRVGTADYAVPAAQVLHLESYDSATPVPGAPSYVAGLVQVRGRLVPVVDLRARFGLAPVPHSIDHRVVVCQVGTRVAGLLVDSARDVIRIEDGAFEKPPDLVEQQAGGFIKGIATVTKKMFLLVDVPRIIGEELSHG